MVKNTLCFLFVITSIYLFSQNKKEQIVVLNHSIDSLNRVISNYRDTIQNKLNEIDLLSNSNKLNLIEISNLKKEIDYLKRIENQNSITISELSKQKDISKNISKLNNCIVIHSDKPFRGFDLTIFYYPKKKVSEFENLFEGYCVFNFYKDGKVKCFEDSEFSLPLYSAKGIEFSEDSIEVLKCPYQEIIVESNELPITFIDINFDGNAELILKNKGNGQLSSSLYWPFEIIKNGLLEEIYNISGKIPDGNFFDELTEYDEDRKEISFYDIRKEVTYLNVYKVGVNSSGYWIYKFIKYYTIDDY